MCQGVGFVCALFRLQGAINKVIKGIVLRGKWYWMAMRSVLNDKVESIEWWCHSIGMGWGSGKNVSFSVGFLFFKCGWSEKRDLRLSKYFHCLTKVKECEWRNGALRIGGGGVGFFMPQHEKNHNAA